MSIGVEKLFKEMRPSTKFMKIVLIIGHAIRLVFRAIKLLESLETWNGRRSKKT